MLTSTGPVALRRSATSDFAGGRLELSSQLAATEVLAPSCEQCDSPLLFAQSVQVDAVGHRVRDLIPGDDAVVLSRETMPGPDATGNDESLRTDVLKRRTDAPHSEPNGRHSHGARSRALQ